MQNIISMLMDNWILCIVFLFVGGLPIIGGKTIAQWILGFIQPKPVPDDPELVKTREAAVAKAEQEFLARQVLDEYKTVRDMVPDGVSDDEVFKTVRESRQKNPLDWITEFISSIFGGDSMWIIIAVAVGAVLLFSTGCAS